MVVIQIFQKIPVFSLFSSFKIFIFQIAHVLFRSCQFYSWWFIVCCRRNKPGNCQEKRFLPFASIPLLFALQQFSEGFVWLSLENANYAEFQYYSVNIFLIFAQVVWPFFVPLSYLIMEPDPKRKKWLIGFTLIGLMVSAFLAASMYVNLPKASVKEYHIRYDLKFLPYQLNYQGIPYFLATVVSAFFSSIKELKYFAIAILASIIVTEIFYSDYLVSVWCFFAALMSGIIYFIIRSQRKIKSTN